MGGGGVGDGVCVCGGGDLCIVVKLLLSVFLRGEYPWCAGIARCTWLNSYLYFMCFEQVGDALGHESCGVAAVAAGVLLLR